MHTLATLLVVHTLTSTVLSKISSTHIYLLTSTPFFYPVHTLAYTFLLDLSCTVILLYADKCTLLLVHWLAREGDGINGPVQIGDKGHPCQHHHRPRRLDQHLQRRLDQHLQSVLQPRSTLHCRFHPNCFVSSLKLLNFLLKIGIFFTFVLT